MKRVLIIMVVLAIVIGGSVAGYQFLNPEPYDIAQDPEVEVIEIGLDTILATVNASGRIEPEEEVKANFETSGTVAEIFVVQGEDVTQGDLLARLDTVELELALRRAQTEVDRAQAQLDQLYEPASAEEIESARAAVTQAEVALAQLYDPASDEDIASAQAAVDSAQANLDKVLAGKNENEVTVAAANLRKAEIALKKAQWAYDQVAYLGEVGAMSQAAELEQATIEYETARANYSLAVQDPENADVLSAEAQLAQARASLAKIMETPKQSEIAAAEAQLAQARANLAKLLEDPKEPDIMAAQSSVEAVLVGLEQAQLNLDRATLETSISGVVSEVNIKVGEDSTYLSGDDVTSRSAVTILDLSAFHIEVEIDEIDIGRIAVGQNVIIILDAIPDVEYEGHVSSISPGPIATSSGVVAYQVSVGLDNYDSRLLPGMTANTTIETDRLEDIVVVPNRAVRIERENGSVVATVDKLNEAGKPERQDIELGLRNDTVSQVLSGLEEGDKVVIMPQSRREQLQQAFQGGD